MLIPQKAQCRTNRRQGCRAVSLEELRDQLANPSKLNDGNRQCLLDLVNRLARVRALGDEFTRVNVSPSVAQALAQQASV